MLNKRIINELSKYNVINLNLKKKSVSISWFDLSSTFDFCKKYLLLLFTSSQVKIRANINYLYHKYLVNKILKISKNYKILTNFSKMAR